MVRKTRLDFTRIDEDNEQHCRLCDASAWYLRDIEHEKDCLLADPAVTDVDMYAVKVPEMARGEICVACNSKQADCLLWRVGLGWATVTHEVAKSQCRHYRKVAAKDEVAKIQCRHYRKAAGDED